MESTDSNTLGHDEEPRSSVTDYLARARAACAEGDAKLGMHLYLAAFEEDAAETDASPSEDAILGLKNAWMLACTNKERSLAEHIFERMEPYLTSDEIAVCADELQNLALDHLEEFGLTRDDLENMAQTISQDLLGVGARVVKVEHVMDRPLVRNKAKEASAFAEADEAKKLASAPSASDEADGAGKTCSAEAGDGKLASAADAAGAKASGSRSASAPETAAEFLAKAAEEMDLKLASVEEVLTYDNLAGYDSTVRIMRDLGIGLQDDGEFQSLVGLLNARHGLDRMPALDTLLFRSPAREDASRFVEATIGELKLPVLRMHMEESLQGMPVLCVTAQASDEAPKASTLRDLFEHGGVLVLEDVDMWGAPLADLNEEPANIIAMQLSRGAREAVNLIRSAVDNPEVYVLASASAHGEIDGFFLDLLEPLSIVDIDYPTPEERVDIWMDLARQHPSMRGVNRADLVRLSANMPRFDIYMAAREALEEAYKAGLMSRHYQPVTRDNLFDKLAAYQPLESREYRELEEAVISDFRADLAHLDDLLKGE